MIERIEVHEGRYHDSAFLMRLGRQLEGAAGVQEAVLLMATEMNRDLLRQAGFPADALADAGPMDLVVAIRADDAAAADGAATRALELLTGEPGARVAAGGAPPPPRGGRGPPRDRGGRAP